MFRFEKLEIWKKSIEITDDIFNLADQLDERRKYRFTEQIRSAALSISNNIAEGSGSLSRPEFRQFINYSHRSVSETANMLIICQRREYITEEAKIQFLDRLEEISRMLTGFSRSLSFPRSPLTAQR